MVKAPPCPPASLCWAALGCPWAAGTFHSEVAEVPGGRWLAGTPESGWAGRAHQGNCCLPLPASPAHPSGLTNTPGSRLTWKSVVGAYSKQDSGTSPTASRPKQVSQRLKRSGQSRGMEPEEVTDRQEERVILLLLLGGPDTHRHGLLSRAGGWGGLVLHVSPLGPLWPGPPPASSCPLGSWGDWTCPTRRAKEPETHLGAAAGHLMQ